MFSLRIYIHILLQVVGIVTVITLGILGIWSGKAIILGCIGILAGVSLIAMLVSYLNHTNKRIQLFFDSIHDNESVFHFPEDTGSKDEQQLHKAVNRINTLLNESKMESRKNEHFYRALLQHVPGGVIAWGTDGIIKIINNAAQTLFKDIPLKYISQVEKHIPGFGELIEKAVRKDSVIFKWDDAGSIRQYSLSASKVSLREEDIIILILTDIGKELSKKEFESWEKITHVLTHEIMNSIAPIVSLSATLLSYFQQDGKPKDSPDIPDTTISKTIRGLDTIKTQGRGLLRFTESYRSLANLQPPEKAEFSLNELVDDILLLFQSDIERQNIQLSAPGNKPGIIISADKQQLSQVIINIIRNALEALKETKNGRIGINISQDKATQITITDNGPGIPANVMNDIFIPFFTTKKTGTGIGLSLSREIIRMHNGEIYFHSEPYTHTTVRIILPLNESPESGL